MQKQAGDNSIALPFQSNYWQYAVLFQKLTIEENNKTSLNIWNLHAFTLLWNLPSNFITNRLSLCNLLGKKVSVPLSKVSKQSTTKLKFGDGGFLELDDFILPREHD